MEAVIKMRPKMNNAFEGSIYKVEFISSSVVHQWIFRLLDPMIKEKSVAQHELGYVFVKRNHVKKQRNKFL